MKDILCVLPLDSHHYAIIEEAAGDNRLVFADQNEVTVEQIESAHIILGNVVPYSKYHAPDKLEYLALQSAGADMYLQPGILSEKTVITNATGVYSKPVAEHGLAMTLMLQKNLHLYRDFQHSREWRPAGETSSIADSVVLVVGLGNIGLYYARLVKALGAYVIGVKRRAGDCPEYVNELYTTDKLNDVIGRADVIFSVLPGTKATYHLYNGEMFSRMKPAAIFINCGRGASVDTEALCDALESGTIRAAGCDVFETEPLPAGHRAWSLPNLEITPHRAGFFDLPGTLDDLVALSAENLKAYLSGGELKNIVDRASGYRR